MPLLPPFLLSAVLLLYAGAFTGAAAAGGGGTERSPLFATMPSHAEDSADPKEVRPNWLLASAGRCDMQARDLPPRAEGEPIAGRGRGQSPAPRATASPRAPPAAGPTLTCTATAQTLQFYDPPIELERTGHTATYIARIGFRYFPMETTAFTDAPFHASQVLPNGASQATLMSRAWDNKNVGLLQPNDNFTVPRPPPAPRAPRGCRVARPRASPSPTGRRLRSPSSKLRSTGIARSA